MGIGLGREYLGDPYEGMEVANFLGILKDTALGRGCGDGTGGRK